MKRFTLIVASMLIAFGAMAQINYGKRTWTFPATSHEAVTEVPAEIFTDFAEAYTDSELTNDKVGVFVTDVRVATEGNVTATFAWNGGNIRMDISGVDLVDADGNIASLDYHFGFAGGQLVNNVYTLENVAAGDYTMRIFVAAQKEDITSATNNDSKGKLTIAGAWMYPNESVYYNIKNVRSNKYVTFKGEGKQFTQESANNGAGSYWHFVEASLDDVKKWNNPWLEDGAIPAGLKPYWVYSAACEKAVENVTNGNMSSPDMNETYPGKIYYIGVHTKDGKTGLILRPCHEDGSSWNDQNGGGTALGHYSSNDAGSLWSIELANIDENDLIAMGTAAKNEALATVSACEQAFYYNPTAEQIDAAKTEINNIDCSTVVSALMSVINGLANEVQAEIANSKVTPKAGDRFMIKGNVQQNDYLIAAEDGNVRTTNGIGATDINALDLVWTLKTATVEGKFNLYNERLGVYVAPLSTTNNATMGYTTKADEAGVYAIELKGTNVVFHADGQDGYGYIHHPRWNTAGSDKFKAVTRWEGNDANSQWQLVEAPFELTTNIKEPICYAIKSGRDGNYYFTLENNKIKLVNNADIVGNVNAQWFFMLDENKNLKIYPAADPNNTMGYITVADGNTKLTNDHSVAGYVADTYTLYYNTNNAANNNGKCFAFRPTEGNTFVSNHGGTGNYMGFYNEHNDKGTRVGFESVAAVTLQNKIATWEQYFANEGDKVCQYKIAEDVKNVVNAAVKVAVTKSSNNADYAREIAALDVLTFPSINLPQVGSYYRLKNGASDWYATSDLRTGETQHADKLYMAEDGTHANTIWYVGDNNALLSYTKGQYLGDMSSDWSFEAVGSTGNATTFVQGATIGRIQIKPSNGRSLYGDKIRVDAADEGNNSGNYEWVIEEVTELPVTISAAKYATFYAPVAVEVPEGVTAHTVTINGEWATLSDALTVIPANTGVVLAGEMGAYDFAITTAEAFEGENLMTGTVAKALVTKPENTECYVLAKPAGAEAAGMYKAAIGEDATRFYNAGHKAYLAVPGSNGIASYSFRFEGEGTTAIENVEVENEVKAIYDLTGRRVEEITVPGIYIVNGKKVLVK